MTLYATRLSPFVAMVEMALQIKGCQYEQILLGKDGFASAEYRQINPFGTVPALIDGPVQLFESRVIIDYLEHKYPRPVLLPLSAEAAAPVRLLAAVAVEWALTPSIRLFKLWRAQAAGSEKSDHVQTVQDTKAEVSRGFDVLEKLIGDNRYAAGATLSLADVTVAPTLFFAWTMGAQSGVEDTIAGRPKLASYWERIVRDPIYSPIRTAHQEQMDTMLAGPWKPK